MKTGLSRIPLRFFLIACCLVASVASGQQKPEIKITEGGVGAINARTPFSIESIGRLFPRYKVVTGVHASMGFTVPTIQVINRGFELFEVIPNEELDGIGSVIVKSAEVRLSGKGKIGDLYTELFSTEPPALCFPGQQELTGSILCRRSNSSHIGFIFGGDSNSEALKTSRVQDIVWKPVPYRSVP